MAEKKNLLCETKFSLSFCNFELSVNKSALIHTNQDEQKDTDKKIRH
jgi:hypothetical protein